MTHDAHSGTTIMIVEDQPATREALIEFIRTAFHGCRILFADSAERALELCTSTLPHLVVMDIALPGMNGIDATQRIKALFPGVHVVIHSSADMPIYRDEAAAAGASAFVGKSRAATELVPVLARLLAAEPARGPD